MSIDLRYRVLGQGPPVLLIHGAGADGDTWPEAELEGLARDHRVIAYNRRGYRGSGEPAGSWDRHREDAVQLLRELDAVPATVVGFSAGGIVALDLAVRHPEKVSGLLLIDPAVYMRRYLTADFVRMYLTVQATRLLRGERRGAEVFYRWATSYRTGGSAWERPDFPEERREGMRANAHALSADAKGGDGSHIPRRQLEKIACPVTLARTELSPPFLHKVADNLRELLPASHRFQAIAGSGHALGFDRPGEWERLIREVAATGVAR